MKRRSFLKLFGIGAASITIPSLSNTDKKQTFTIDEAFLNCSGNDNLLYIKKDSLLNRELMKAIGNHYLPRDKFGCYYPAFNQYIPIKDEYSVDDFSQLIMLLKDKREKFDYFCDGQIMDGNVGLIRLIKDRSGKFYKIDLFQAFKNGQYGNRK